MVTPGPAADLLLEELGGALTSIRDDRTGRALVRRIWRPGDRYAGPFLEQLPDLLVEWSDEIATGTTAIPISVLDFAPTIAATLGAPLPGTDGVVIEELLDAEARRR